jgi:hypothetical protein
VLNVLGMHKVGVVLRQLVQQMQVLGADRLSEGSSHRPRMLSGLLLSTAAALLRRYPAIELLAVESLWPLAR